MEKKGNLITIYFTSQYSIIENTIGWNFVTTNNATITKFVSYVIFRCLMQSNSTITHQTAHKFIKNSKIHFVVSIEHDPITRNQIFRCTHCGKIILPLQFEVNIHKIWANLIKDGTHIRECEAFPVECKYCNKMFTRGTIASHSNRYD